MFENNKDSSIHYDLADIFSVPRYRLAAIAGFLIVVNVVIFSFAYTKYREYRGEGVVAKNDPLPTVRELEQRGIDAGTATSTLPVNESSDGSSGPAKLDDLADVKAENLAFASFYKSEGDDFKPTPRTLKLPLMVKTDVSNYYEITRKINLDNELEALNKNGFTVIDNPFSSNADNFYAAYAALGERGIPKLLSSDFLLYYYQNRIKNAFSEVKSNVFFQDLWHINKEFFEIANNRYKKTKAASGVSNDALLEGQRLEAAYFAVGLELLKPKHDQIVSGSKTEDEAKFSDVEAQYYSFELPEYLLEDVKKEVSQIMEARGDAKSPVLLSDRNYREFASASLPGSNAKLANFNLATKWLNSVYPLYFKSDYCPDCSLDKNDWLITFIAANYIAKDFTDNQELKNRWARIYKVLSFFSGLRKDLTYLHYTQVMTDQYGAAYEIENIFQPGEGRENFDKKLASAVKIRDEINKRFSFSKIEGGLDRSDAKLRPKLGMRVLQQAYWPDDYLFSELIAPKVGRYVKSSIPDKKKNITLCQPSRGTEATRCVGVSLDIVNLISPVVRNAYFEENTSYVNYTNQANSLKTELSKFSFDSWHGNQYWSTLDIARRSFFGKTNFVGPINQSGAIWRDREIDNFLGAWVGLRLPEDTLGVRRQDGSSLNVTTETEAFIEPNLNLINELLANAKMLNEMFKALRVVKESDFTSKQLVEFIDELGRVKELMKKELRGEALTVSDHAEINNLLNKYAVVREGAKEINFTFTGGRSISQSIKGVRLMLSVYQLENKKLLVAAPVFNQKEAGSGR